MVSMLPNSLDVQRTSPTQNKAMWPAGSLGFLGFFSLIGIGGSSSSGSAVSCCSNVLAAALFQRPHFARGRVRYGGGIHGYSLLPKQRGTIVFFVCDKTGACI